MWDKFRVYFLGLKFEIRGGGDSLKLVDINLLWVTLCCACRYCWTWTWRPRTNRRRRSFSRSGRLPRKAVRGVYPVPVLGAVCPFLSTFGEQWPQNYRKSTFEYTLTQGLRGPYYLALSQSIWAHQFRHMTGRGNEEKERNVGVDPSRARVLHSSVSVKES